MANSEQLSPATLLDQLADLDPQERREVATIVRGLSETFAEVPDGRTETHAVLWGGEPFLTDHCRRWDGDVVAL
jgi:hypothetical protein